MNSRLALLLTAGALAVTAAPAAAATSLGGIAPGLAGLGGCTNCGQLQTQTAPGSVPYVVPAGGGVITSWTFRDVTKATAARLRLFEPGPGAGQYTLIAETPYRDFNLGETATTLTQIPVAAGVHLGIAVTAADQQYYTLNSGDKVSSNFDVLAPIGASQLLTESDGRHVNIAATLEPDADHDGYGDETQDACPSDPTQQLNCSQGAPPIPAAPHQPSPPSTPTPPAAGNQTGAITVKAGSFVSLVTPARESIKSGFVTVAATSVGQVTLSASGKVSGRALGSTTTTIAAGQRVTLKLRIPKKTLHAVRKRLAHHQKVSAKVTVSANGTTTAVTVRLAR
jgi:hypothetical protein